MAFLSGDIPQPMMIALVTEASTKVAKVHRRGIWDLCMRPAAISISVQQICSNSELALIKNNE